MSYGDHIRHGVGEGMGGYLDPPGYPTHTYSVGTGRKDNPNGLMSLESAVAADYLKPAIRAKARQLLAAWHANRPALDSPEVQAWIADCQRHWAGCWYAEPDEYGCPVASAHSKHPQPRPADALDYATYHIRRFYPEYGR